MRRSLFFLALLLAATFFESEAEAHPIGGALVKHLSSFLRWSTTSPKTPQDDGNVLQFENGYLVETLVEGNKLGVAPHTIRVSPEGELFVVDSVNSNIVRITPPLSQYSRARLVAGSFQGYSGHVDGKPTDARFSHPKGVTMDDKGNVYVADTANLAIRKIGEGGVTTIAGGKSNVAGYRDGPSEDAQFSTDFDVVYVKSTCSLLVVDRGNAALRQISLQEGDCNYQFNSISASDVIMVIGAVLAGYASCFLHHHGFGHSASSSKKQSPGEMEQQASTSDEKPKLVVESLKEDVDAGWPSLGRLLSDLFQFAMEAIGNLLFVLVPSRLMAHKPKGLTPLRDRLIMPEDHPEPPSHVKKQLSSPPPSETMLAPKAGGQEVRTNPHKSSKPAKVKDSATVGKHRSSSSKKQEYAEFYGSSDSAQLGTKSQKDRPRHRHREKGAGEAVFGVGSVSKPAAEVRGGVDYRDSKFDHYNSSSIRSKFGTDGSFNY